MADLSACEIHSLHEAQLSAKHLAKPSLDRFLETLRSALVPAVPNTFGMSEKNGRVTIVCAKADAKALFKAIQALHRDGWQIEEPAVKAHVALKAKVLVQDVCGALEDAASLHLQHSGWTLVQRGQLVQSSVFHCPEEELDVLRVTLRCTEDWAGGALFNVAVQTFKSRKFAIDRMLRGELGRKWRQVQLAPLPEDSAKALAREVNFALQGSHCKLLPGFTPCTIECAISERKASDLRAELKLPPGQAAPYASLGTSAVAGVAVNFNGDGSLWACVAPDMLLTSSNLLPAAPLAKAPVLDAVAACLLADASKWLGMVTTELQWQAEAPQTVTGADGHLQPAGAAEGAGPTPACVRPRHEQPHMTPFLQKLLHPAEASSSELAPPAAAAAAAGANRKPATLQFKRSPGMPGTIGAAKRPGQTTLKAKAKAGSRVATPGAAGGVQVPLVKPRGIAKKAGTAPGGVKAPGAASALARTPQAQGAGTSTQDPAQAAAGGQLDGVPTAVPRKAAERMRKKASDFDATQAEAVLRTAHAAGTLQKVSVPEMKAFLKSRGLLLGGKKAEIIERVVAALAA